MQESHEDKGVLSLKEYKNKKKHYGETGTRGQQQLRRQNIIIDIAFTSMMNKLQWKARREFQKGIV